MYQSDTKKARNNQTQLNLHQHDTRIDTQRKRLKTLKTKIFIMTTWILH